MDDDDRALFERSLQHATERDTGAALDATLDEIGWADALADDPRAAISTLFELQGGANVTSSAIGSVLARGLGLTRDRSRSVVLPTIGRWDPPGRIDGHDLVVRGLSDAGLTGSEAALVVGTDGHGRIVAATIATSALELHPVAGIDPTLGLVGVTATAAPIDGDEPLGPDHWAEAVALARMAVAHELVGASRRMLELAREHALDRIQFDRPISTFQAVRHRLAETLVAIEMADAVLDAAWLDRSSENAAMAKAVAGHAARTTVRHCQQVLAGIGFTTEHPLHRHVRRTFVLDGLFGTSASLTEALGDELLTTRQLPPLLAL